MRPTHKFQVISYIIIAALADVYPTATHFNRAAAILQVIFIYVIEMVSALVIPHFRLYLTDTTFPGL
jgi:hypothetical protein